MHLTIAKAQQLDRVHVLAWSLGRLTIGVTRVVSQGETHTRTHVWPGDPDEVALLIRNAGFQVRLCVPEPVDAHRETVVYVTGFEET